MQRSEFDILVEWAAKEGWNPGLHDAEIFWDVDPDGFVTAEFNGEMVGGGSIISYGGTFGFMGFFIMRPDFRGKGYGNLLWNWRRNHLLSRLKEPKIIGMDGVFTMQSYYAKGGFTFHYRGLRFEGSGYAHSCSADIIDLTDVSFPVVEQYDQNHFPAKRKEFLERWIRPEGGHAVGILDGDFLFGYAVLRPCRLGYKIGPLFADNPVIAEKLFQTLSSRVPGEPIFLDVPEINPEALVLARNHGMKEVFGCARMYYGFRPELPMHEIFGITTFELG